jgi:thioredoxin-like negative regulator of GroEL
MFIKNNSMIKKLTCLCFLVLATTSLSSQTQTESTDTANKIMSDLSVEAFKKYTNRKDKLVLVNFNANWCVVCKKQKPILDEIKIEKQGTVEVIEINMEENPLIAEYFEVDGLPMNLLYKNGLLVWDRMGFKQKKEFLEVIATFEKKIDSNI